MFKNLLNFEHTRTANEAIGFYLAFLLLNLVIGGALGALFVQNNSFSSGWQLGVYGAVITQLVIGILILSEKKRYKNLFYLILVILSLVLSKIGGGLLGLIPLSYLTTQ